MTLKKETNLETAGELYADFRMCPLGKLVRAKPSELIKKCEQESSHLPHTSKPLDGYVR